MSLWLARLSSRPLDQLDSAEIELSGDWNSLGLFSYKSGPLRIGGLNERGSQTHSHSSCRAEAR